MEKINLMRMLSTVTIVTLYTTTLVAQDCDAITKFGVFSQKSDFSTIREAQFQHKWMCDQNFSSHDEAKSSGLKIGLDVDDLGSASLDYTASEKNFSSWYHSYCQANVNDLLKNDQYRIKVQKADQAIVDAWRACIQKPGVHMWIEPTLDSSVFNIVLVYQPFPHTINARVTSFNVTGKVTCKRAPRKVEIQEIRDTCKVKSPGPVTATINTDQGSTSVSVNAALTTPVSLPPLRLALRRYWIPQGSGGFHIATTLFDAKLLSGTDEGVRGYLLDTEAPHTKPLYDCIKANGAHFLSYKATCDGAGSMRRREGYILDKRADATEELFLCSPNEFDYFVSFDQNCEGKRRVTSLGYVYQAATAN